MNFYQTAKHFKEGMKDKINVKEVRVKPEVRSTADDLLNKIDAVIDIDCGHTQLGMVIGYKDDCEAPYLGQFSDISALLAIFVNKLISDREVRNKECKDYFYIVGFNSTLYNSKDVVLVTLKGRKVEK